jgi:benzaldehyde dehydrogenase (NAD)
MTLRDESDIPFGASGARARFGGAANLEAFTDTRWTTIRGGKQAYPF